jgi:hypothetical protein
VEYSGARVFVERKTCVLARTRGFEFGARDSSAQSGFFHERICAFGIVPENNSHRSFARSIGVYRCEVRSVSEFIHHVAVNYISRGYFFYVKGEIPPHKDPARTDAKIIKQYGIDVSKWVRWRRRQRGCASVQYLRCRRRFVILATHGKHRFFRDEAKAVQDVRRSPFRFGGYSVGFRAGEARGHVSVKIERERFLELKEYFLKRALRAPVEELITELRSFCFASFAPVRAQLFMLVGWMNESRRCAGLEEVPVYAVLGRIRRLSCPVSVPWDCLQLPVPPEGS